ncbi:MAG: acyl-CoA carboxylase subunit epsilon [Ornithinimicrobium sp.]
MSGSDATRASGGLAVTVSGRPTPAETAVVVVVLSMMTPQESASPSPRSHSLWNSRGRAARPRLAPGPGAWQGSVSPR